MEAEFDFTGQKNIRDYVATKKKVYKKLLDKYKDPATQYAYDVLFEDTFMTNRDTQLACARHFQDLTRQGDDDFPYVYDTNWVDTIEWFARSIPDPTDTNKLIEPMGWQSFILDSLIGWRHIEQGSRYHTAIVSVARGQGKTWLASILVNFFYFMIGWQATSQDFLVASYDSDHAKKLFDYVSLQAKVIINLPEFAAEAKERDVDAQTYQVIGRNNKNIIRMGSSQAGGFDSRHNIVAVYDEIGAMQPKYNESINQIISGQSKIANRLFLEISTAYPDIKVKFKSDQDTNRKLIEADGKREADDTFMIIYSQDDENEVYEPETWEKSNPLLGHPELKEQLLDGLIGLRDKQEREGTLASYANKSMNIWSRRFQNSFLSLDSINRNIFDGVDIKGRDVFIGFDGSQVNDNTSFGFEIPYQVGSDHLFYAKQYSFIPFKQAKTLKAKIKQDGLDYLELEKLGFCEVTDMASGTIDNQQVYQWLVNFVANKQLKVRAVVADPNLAAWFVKMIENYQPNWPLYTLAPTSYKLSVPTKDFQNQFVNGNIKIEDDALLIDGLNNAVLVEDRGGAIKIDRQNRTSDHIDTADALINAHSQAQYYYEDFHDENYNPLNNMNREQKKDLFKTMFGNKK